MAFPDRCWAKPGRKKTESYLSKKIPLDFLRQSHEKMDDCPFNTRKEMNDDAENHYPEGNGNSSHSGPPAHCAHEVSWPYGHRGERTNGSHGNSTDWDVGVADYYSRKPKRSTGTLVALAPHVLLLARCEGAPETAKYFAERLGVNVTERMIKTLKTKVAQGLIVVTRGELEAAALSHPITAARMIREPAICDPQHYRAAITPEPETHEVEMKKASVRKAAAKKATARKVEKKAEAQKEKKTQSEAKTTPIVQRATSGTPSEKPNPHPEAPRGMEQIVNDEEAAENARLMEEAERQILGLTNPRP